MYLNHVARKEAELRAPEATTFEQFYSLQHDEKMLSVCSLMFQSQVDSGREQLVQGGGCRFA